MIDKFCFTTISFGDRYYEQTKRFIEDRDNYCPHIPLIVITDNVNYFSCCNNVIAVNVGDYNPKYMDYKTNYYNFDNSCKRYIVPASIKLGYKNFVYLDNDNHFIRTWNEELFKKLFIPNHILSPIAYRYMEHGQLGKKVESYSKLFSFPIERNEIINLPEGCLNIFSFDTNERAIDFYNIWNECVRLRDEYKLIDNTSLQEIFFAGKVCGMSFGIAKVHSFFHAKHDLWYR
jgi:hypothetical protein